MSGDKSSRVVIVGAKRSPVGVLSGGLSSVPAHQIGAQVIQALLKSTGVSPNEVSEVILGQALQAGCGQNPSRQAALAAGLPNTTPASTVNMLCGSGLRSVMFATQAIRCGDSSVVVCGGQESMSLAPHVVNMRAGVKFGDVKLVDSMMHDGLTDAMLSCHMGITAENVAKQWSITREEQDKFSVDSQTKCGQAMSSGQFEEEIVPITVKSRKGETIVKVDEHPRPDTNSAALGKLSPAFIRDGTGSVTAGNASGINDGAACVLVMSGEEASRRGQSVLCEVVSFGQAGVDPSIMGTGPIPAIKNALNKAGWSIDDVDVFELNEAFAAQSLAVVRDLKIDPKKVNVRGGAIALGHPIGASGGRVLVTLCHVMTSRNVSRGVAALCVGGGQGIAVCLQRETSS